MFVAMAMRRRIDQPLPSPSSSRWQLWSTRLWLLSAILAGVTIYSFVSLIHDQEQRRAAARVVASSTARNLLALATTRLEVFGLGAFAPLAQTDVDSVGSIRQRVTRLARRQQASESCRCREILPANEFFGVRVASRTLARIPVSTDDSSRVATPSDSALLALARAEAVRAQAGGRQLDHGTLHLSGGAAFGSGAALTIVQREGRDSALVVYGVLGPARDFVQSIFFAADSASGDSMVGVPHLDFNSLQVSAADGSRLFGDVNNDHPIRAMLGARGALEGLRITVALSPHQIPHPMMVFITPDRLWHNGVLILCTTIAIVLAIGASRREILLARARSDFIAGVSHDLRMPLAQILLAGETLSLRRERDDAERMALTSSIVREAQRLTALVENVLLFTRSGKVTIRAQLEQVRIDDLYADVVDSVQLAVADAEQTIHAPLVPLLSVLGDRHLLRLAMVNLVDNAIKYGPPGQRITLGAEPVGDTRVRLYVDDEGPGIPARERTRVFEPYERLARDQVSERTGSGLGLAVVRQIADACQGKAWIEAAPGGGTRIIVELRGIVATASLSAPAGVA